MKHLKLAIIGSGASSIYCLQHIANHSKPLLKQFQSISIFEKNEHMGFGMPYNPKTTDHYNLSNISSEEIPQLPQSFAEWLKSQDKEFLDTQNVTNYPISEDKIYSRIALGHYFHNQFNNLIKELQDLGFAVNQFTNHQVQDIIPMSDDSLKIIANHSEFVFNRVVISTGHNIPKTDKPDTGYYESPWPILKIIPNASEYYNFEIGLLGASLSAFDVVSTLAHRHGKFHANGDQLDYVLNPKAKDFKITLHAAEGWLPHLQYEQEEPLREIYRHASREDILNLLNTNGFLKIDSFFNEICRSTLIKAFTKDQDSHMVSLLKDETFTFKNFIETMIQSHEYVDCFDGMKKELPEAKTSVSKNKPIHWMETLDDLMYCLNFHMELLPAEDNLFFNTIVKPFLMSVIAALPLESAKILLSLYDANVIDLEAGKVSINETSKNKQTTISIEKSESDISTKTYNMFINCAGSDTIEYDTYPFKSLVQSGKISKASIRFENSAELISDLVPSNRVYSDHSGTYIFTGGIAIDSAFRIVGKNNTISPNIYDISFPHIYGTRPYSYGLQACNATSAIVVDSWLSSNVPKQSKISVKKITNIYNSDPEL